MKEEIKESVPLFERHETCTGVATGSGCVITSDHVAMYAASAAYRSVIQSLSIVDLVQR